MGLKAACTIGDLERVKELISSKDYEEDKDRALKLVSEYGYLDIVKYLVEQGADIHTCDDYSLRSASCYGHLNIVRYLIENGADIHAEDKYVYIKDDVTCQALRMACWNGHLEVVKCLVENGVNMIDIDLDDEFIFYGNSEVLEYLGLVKSLKILSKPWKERQKFKRIKE